MKSVVICGSKRFEPEVRAFSKKLKKAGVIVFEPYLLQDSNEWQGLSDQYQKLVTLGLVHEHFYKIKMADIVFVYNKDGYSGVSTAMELGYAMALGKVIYALAEDNDEAVKNVLFREILPTPEKLFEKLT